MTGPVNNGLVYCMIILPAWFAQSSFRGSTSWRSSLSPVLPVSGRMSYGVCTHSRSLLSSALCRQLLLSKKYCSGRRSCGTCRLRCRFGCRTFPVRKRILQMAATMVLGLANHAFSVEQRLRWVGIDDLVIFLPYLMPVVVLTFLAEPKTAADH